MAHSTGLVPRCGRSCAKAVLLVDGTIDERERVKLYGQVSPPGDPFLINVEPVSIKDAVPANKEIREVVREMRNTRATGSSRIRAEHMKMLLRGAIEEEETGTVGAGHKWRV